MKNIKGIAIAGGIAAIFFVFMLIMFSYGISVANHEVTLRNNIVAKQKDNTSEYDNMWKKISQVAQVTEGQKEALREIFVEHAQARSGSGNNGAIMSWIQESVPNVDTSTFNSLMNTITGSRDTWTMHQKQLIDLKREHDILLQKFPSNIILGMLGRQPVEIKVVTSTRTEEAFESEIDNDLQVFGESFKYKK